MSQVGVVVIGRNEGERLKRCLRSLRQQTDKLVYVDSGSKDDSVPFARSLGVEVVTLDDRSPFTAARGRNAGFAALRSKWELDYAQFVDGDCVVAPGWIEAASAAMDADPSLGIVTGWRTEVDPTRNVYHAMCEHEWHRPPGDIIACGGDMMVRVAAFQAAGGFDPRIVVSEDEEFCLRLAARTGLRVYRIPRIMTYHDINMSHLSEWWWRHVRTGHGFTEIGGLYPSHFRRERLRMWIYGLGLPIVTVGGVLSGEWWLVALCGSAYILSWGRTAFGLHRQGGLSAGQAILQAAFLTLSKIPNVQGMLTFMFRRLRQQPMRLIEYK